MDRVKIIAKLEKMCKKYDRKNYPGIAVAVVENGEMIFSKGYGEANLEYNIPIDENTVFHACSMTKQFTAACIALLIEEGKLSLDDEVSSILHQFKDCGEKVTVYNLLYMTNGLPDVYDTAYFACGIREDEGITRDEFWRYVKACDWKLFKPGEKWSYGNTGYFLLGQIVEAVTNMSLSEYADEHIFKPLGMNSTFIRDDRTKIIKNRAAGYSNYDHVHFNDSYERYTSRKDVLSINEENVEVGGAGQMWTTVKDMLLWNENFYNNKIGKGSSEFIKFITNSGLLSNGKECGYGCGLAVGEFYGNKIVHHGGWAGGYSAYYAQLPEKKSSVIVLGNHTDFMYDLDFAFKNGGLTESILKLLIGYENKDGSREENKSDNIGQSEIDSKLPCEHINASQLKFYEGSYCCEKLNVSYNVKVDNGKLFVSNNNLHNNAMDLYYTFANKDVFISDNNSYNGNRHITFMRGSDNGIVSFSYGDDEQNLRGNFMFVKIK